MLNGRIVRVIFAVACLFSSHAAARDSKSLSDVLRGIDQLASSLGTTREQDGDNGPQFALLANMFKVSAERIRSAYAGQLETPFAALPSGETDALSNLLALSREAGTLNLREAPTSRLNDLIYRIHASVNTLFDHLPATDKPPAYFGTQTKYFLQNTSYSSYDLLILGYHLVDQGQGNRRPDVVLSSGSSQVSPTALDATFSRLAVRLPLPKSEELRLNDSPCRAPTLTVKLKIYYSQGLIWNLFTQSRILNISDDFVQPTQNYSILIELEGHRNTQAVTQIPVSVVSDQYNVGCDETRSASISWAAPTGTVEIGPFSAQWVNTNNTQTVNAQVSVNGVKGVTAVGLIRGLEKQHFAFGIVNCPGGGHGALQLTGSYRIGVPTSAPFVFSQTFAAKLGDNVFPVPSGDATAYNNIKVSIQKTTCRVSLATVSGAVSSDQKRLELSSADSRLTVSFEPGHVRTSIR